jgi:YegS/Rv2252/BmrU family lipid kinase
MKKVCVVYNLGSGGSKTDIEHIRTLFDSSAIELICIKLHKEFAKEVRQAKTNGAQVLIAAGGDGTVNAVAQCAVDNDMPLGVLPAGTLNHFAKDLGLPSNLQQAADVIAQGKTQKVDYGTVNDRVFVNNSSIGMYPSTVLEREVLQPKIGKWPAAFIVMLKALFKLSTTHLTFETQHEKKVIKTPLAFIGNNEYELETVGFANRTQLTGGTLFLYVIRANRTGAILRLIFVAFFGKRIKKGDYRQTASSLTIQSRKPVLDLAVDGEVVSLQPPLRYKIYPAALQVYVP